MSALCHLSSSETFKRPSQTRPWPNKRTQIQCKLRILRNIPRLDSYKSWISVESRVYLVIQQLIQKCLACDVTPFWGCKAKIFAVSLKYRYHLENTQFTSLINQLKKQSPYLQLNCEFYSLKLSRKSFLSKLSIFSSAKKYLPVPTVTSNCPDCLQNNL